MPQCYSLTTPKERQPLPRGGAKERNARADYRPEPAAGTSCRAGSLERQPGSCRVRSPAFRGAGFFCIVRGVTAPGCLRIVPRRVTATLTRRQFETTAELKRHGRYSKCLEKHVETLCFSASTKCQRRRRSRCYGGWRRGNVLYSAASRSAVSGFPLSEPESSRPALPPCSFFSAQDRSPRKTPSRASSTVWGQAYRFQFSLGSRFPSGKSWDREN